jgi:hypothetical protein
VAFFRAAGLPLLFIIGVTLAWVSGAFAQDDSVALLAIVRAVFLALGIIALSLSYRELPPWPAPPPTPPPS